MAKGDPACIFCSIVASENPASYVHQGATATAFSTSTRSRPVTCWSCRTGNLWVADGEVAGQEVPHVHVHVIPRTTGDGFGVDAEAWHAPPPSRAELDRQAEAIRAALGADR